MDAGFDHLILNELRALREAYERFGDELQKAQDAPVNDAKALQAVMMMMGRTERRMKAIENTIATMKKLEKVEGG